MARKTTITGEGIRDESVDSADIASGSIKAGELSAQSISGQDNNNFYRHHKRSTSYF